MRAFHAKCLRRCNSELHEILGGLTLNSKYRGLEHPVPSLNLWYKRTLIYKLGTYMQISY